MAAWLSFISIDFGHADFPIRIETPDIRLSFAAVIGLRPFFS